MRIIVCLIRCLGLVHLAAHHELCLKVVNFGYRQVSLNPFRLRTISICFKSIKNRVLASKEYQDNLETLVTSLENSYNSLRTIIMEVDAMERNLIRFSSDWRLSQESVLSDMRSMQHIKEKYLNLSKSLSESDRQLSELLSSVEKAPDQRLLMSWKKEIEEIKERKAILSNRVDQYMGIDIDTTKAEKQLSDALSQMASVDSQLQKIMGFNAWN
ncbi:unnamed protein product [Schistosoma bovis]|nr:unnamed protein product [Schistosoma haematobium]CAH8515996.1 unnamed protein product [Schistosoma haematobium]CAH8522634.1 unnamed protein product [Schistosoma bovis]